MYKNILDRREEHSEFQEVSKSKITVAYDLEEIETRKVGKGARTF
jgi:hypothetical protein